MNDTSFQIKLAELNINVFPVTSSLITFCQDYVVSNSKVKDIDFEVVLTNEDIDNEHRLALSEHKCINMSESYLETLALARKISPGLIKNNILLFHGSCIAVDGKGYLFAAPSGVGKSTHVRYWRELLGDRVVMINDDKPVLKICDEEVIAFGSPWDGKHHLNTNIGVPLKAICLLSRDKENHIDPITAATAYPFLFEQSYRPQNAELIEDVLSLTDKMSRCVELYTLGCNMDPESAMIAYKGMTGL